tara:strand:- start:387 stop:542 length:156 start_codon:yes stop_codon:yes gene_type:complete
MSRKDPLEAWSPDNCIILRRRKHLAKCLGQLRGWIGVHEWTDEDDVTNKIK